MIVTGDELVIDATAADISSSGMRIAANVDVPSGKAVVLRFSLPGDARERLMRARIVLSFFDSAQRLFVHGVVFTQYATADRDAIEAFIAENALE